MPVFAKLRGRTSPEEATDDIDLSITATRATLGRPTTVGGASATEGLFLGISAHKSISRAHAQVSWDGRAKPSGKWSIVCLSKNGMTVDKFYWGKGETAALEHHSAVKIGRSMFYFVLPGAPAPAADPAAAPAAAAAPPAAAAAPPAAAAAAAAAAADEPVVKRKVGARGVYGVLVDAAFLALDRPEGITPVEIAEQITSTDPSYVQPERQKLLKNGVACVLNKGDKYFKPPGQPVRGARWKPIAAAALAAAPAVPAPAAAAGALGPGLERAALSAPEGEPAAKRPRPSSEGEG